MYSDSGPQAPAGSAAAQRYHDDARREITDPLRPNARPAIRVRDGRRARRPQARLQRVQRLRPLPPRPAVATPADEYVYSQSAYSNYGNAPKGDICGAPSPGHPYGTPLLDSNGNPIIARHRPAGHRDRDHARGTASATTAAG